MLIKEVPQGRTNEETLCCACDRNKYADSRLDFDSGSQRFTLGINPVVSDKLSSYDMIHDYELEESL